MSFAPVLGPESPTHTFIRSSISAYLSSLATLCSSLVATTFALVDNLATRLPTSCCPVCLFKKLRKSDHSTETKGTALAVHPDETKTTALVFDTGTKTYTLKKLEDIDVEKAIYHHFLPISAQSIKVQRPGGSTNLSEVPIDDDNGINSPRWKRGLRHQPSLVDGFYIIPTSAGTRTTINPKDAHGDQQPQLAELPATPGSFKRKQQHQQLQPVELPADEIHLPIIPQAVLLTPPRLRTPRPRSPNSRKASPLLAPPPSRFELAENGRSSRARSVGSESIQIAYVPSH